MTNFAANIIAALTASSGNRSNVAKTIAAEIDSDGDGKLTGEEFQKVFAVLQRTEELTGGRSAGGGTGFAAAGVRPTIFECTLYPSFSRNYAVSQYQSMEMMSALDKDGDKVISLDELSGAASAQDPATTPGDGAKTDPANTDPTQTDPATTDPATTDPGGADQTTTDPASDTTTTQPAQTPAERADALMAKYDTTNKGYVTLEDIAGAWINDPTLGDVSELANTIQAWDANGDGKITRTEIEQLFTMMDAADAMLASMGATTSAGLAITLADVTDEQLSQIDATRDMLTGWDKDQDGALTRAEIIDGLRALKAQSAPTPTAADYAQAMLGSFDANQDGGLSLDEFEKAVAQDMDATAAKASFDAWDANKDGSISLDELTSGVDAIQQATQIMQSYDVTGKGYFDIDDLQRVLDAAPDKDTRASAADIMAVWDLDGDGHVTTQEVVSQLLLQKTAQPGDATTSTSNTSLPTA